MRIFNYVSRLLNNPDPVIIMPFGGYANDTNLYTQARVLEDEGIEHSEEDSAIKNIWHSFKRFESDEIEGAKVRVQWGEKKVMAHSDSEGYIYVEGKHQLELKHEETLWIPITYQLMEGEKILYEITSTIMKPSPLAEFGVITDMDDTVIDTGVSSTLKWRVLTNSLMKHSHKRLPLEGAHKFYHLLHKGKDGFSQNPFFYLSNSPWNLYDYLHSFLRKYDFPKGTLMLRDLELKKKTKLDEGNKYLKVKHILQTYPKLPFILIGDAAEIDLDIYLKIALSYPEQVKAIYIRAVKSRKRLRRIENLIEEYTDINVMLIRKSTEAIAHARANGFIEATPDQTT